MFSHSIMFLYSGKKPFYDKKGKLFKLELHPRMYDFADVMS